MPRLRLASRTSLDQGPANDQPGAVVRPIDSVHCSLCGVPLAAGSLRHRLISPRSRRPIIACHLCQRAVLGEGYRPAS